MPDTAAGPDAPSPVCDYPAWELMKMYRAGDIVMFMGKPYIALHDNVRQDPTVSTYFWGPYKGCMPAPPAKCEALDRLLPEGEITFNKMFTPTFSRPVIASVYSYADLCKAIATPVLSGFASSGNALQDKREVAAFFANVAIETAYLTAVDEMGHSASEQGYHGRGSLQLTTAANYAEAGAGLGINLSGMPQLGSKEIVVWQTGLWYWMRHANPSVGAPQICHQAIAAGDFGRTVRIIHPTCSRAAERADQYRKNCALLGVDPGSMTNCH